MENRNRASGWQHAKLSGHKNEDLVKELLDTDLEYRIGFLEKIGYPGETIIEADIGGLCEKKVPGVNGKGTKSKTDLKIKLRNDKTVNISIKKSLSGQVYFVRADLFISTFEEQFNKQIPSSVKRAINLFWAAADDAVEIIEKYADKKNKKNYKRQIRHKSLNATTLKNYDERLYDDLLNWFVENAYEITKLSFSAGAVLDKCEWADFVWYINLLGENKTDEILNIEAICQAAQKRAEIETYFGSRNGGTTIQLPFGFVQWHQSQLQFHHNYKKVASMF